MNTVEHFQRLFAYDAWANREVLASLRSPSQAPARGLKFIAHVLSAERLWLERLEQKPQTLAVWPELTLDECDKLAAEQATNWRTYLGGREDSDLERPASYRNSKGESWKSRKEDILIHVIMHSVYHRGQIATEMRAAQLTPAHTDFIHSVRQGFVK